MLKVPRQFRSCPFACDGADDGSRWRNPDMALGFMPIGRMGPPLRSFAADAHDCIMVQVLRPSGYKVVARFEPRPKAGSPLIVIPTAPSGAIVLAAVKVRLARNAARLGNLDRSSARRRQRSRIETKKRLQIEQRTNKGQ